MNGEETFYNIWGSLLSRQPEVIRKAFNSLDDEEQRAVLEHLQKMHTESGWQPEQRESARAALEVIVNSGE